MGFPCGSASKEFTYNVGDIGSIPGLGRFPKKRERLLTPVVWPGKFHGLYSPWGSKESDMTKQLAHTHDWSIGSQVKSDLSQTGRGNRG